MFRINNKDTVELLTLRQLDKTGTGTQFLLQCKFYWKIYQTTCKANYTTRRKTR